MTEIHRAVAIGAPVLVVACALIAGCATTPETPSVRITSPSNGATLEPGDVRIDADVQNFNIVDKQGQANVTGEGHVHFYMDVSPLPSAAGQPAIPANTSALWAHVSGDSYTFENVPPGVHTFAVQLVNNDHTPVVPAVSDTVTVTVTSRS
jgi:hypothetical protein